jgi:excisionase family DNA binding protein
VGSAFGEGLRFVVVRVWKNGYKKDSRLVAAVDALAETILMAGAVQQMMREVLDIRQAAEYLGISGDTLYRYASEGTVPAFKLGNRWRFKRSLLDAWMVHMSGANAPASIAVMPKQKKPMGRAR